MEAITGWGQTSMSRRSIAHVSNSHPARHAILCGPRLQEINMMPFLKKWKDKNPVLLFWSSFFLQRSAVCSRQRRGEPLRCFTKCTRVSSLAGLLVIVFFTRARSAGEGAWLIVADNSSLPPSTTEEINTLCTVEEVPHTSDHQALESGFIILILYYP